jgi:NAD-specific glutamate dehydrogenase
VTLIELSAAYNDLRNATLGRGVKPLVSAALAERVGVAYEKWRAYYGSAGVQADLAASVTASEYVDAYRALVDAAASEGVKVNALPTTPFEKGKVAIEITGFGALAVAAAVIGLFYVARGSR